MYCPKRIHLGNSIHMLQLLMMHNFFLVWLVMLTMKEFKYSFRKICTELSKRMDSNLPSYYHTSSHTHYREGPLPEFS